MEEQKTKPTRKWIEEQIQYHKTNILLNQGSINLLESMLKAGVYLDETPEIKDTN